MMTQNRITQTELIELIASASEITNSEIEQFVKTIFELISETLLEDDVVKIKDLGTFKLTPVQARESVDVNTGERIEIPAHNKISFSPATALRELVNKPFAHFESVLLSDGISFDDLPEFETTDDDEEDEEKLNEKQIIHDKEKKSTKISQSIQSAAKELEDEVTKLAPSSDKKEEKHLQQNTEKTKVISSPKTLKRASQKRSPIWIPVLGGTAIALAALFFLRNDK